MVYFLQKLYFILMLSLFCSTPELQAKPSTCNFTAGWIFAPPMFISKEEGGLDFDLSRLIFSRVDCQITYENIPWVRQLEMVKKKQNIIVFPSIITAEREAFGLFSKAYRKVDRYIWVHQDSRIKASNSDQFYAQLPAMIFGMVRGYLFNEKFDKEVKTRCKELILVNNEKQTVDMLVSRRIDAMATSDYEMQYNLSREQKTSVRKLEFLFDHSSRHFFLPQTADGEHLRSLIDQAIQRVLHTKDYQNILAKYDYESTN
jgi:polar amino acid transport system substrate-binding protein